MPNNIIAYLKYNNYYDRIIRKETNFNNYLEYSLYRTQTSVNFNPADGLTTSVVCDYEFYNNMPNYVVVAEYKGGVINLVSRWFIMESTRNRLGQYTMQLKRDLLADYYTSYVNAPAMIQRATLAENDPYILNSEGQNFNQIKTSETLLKDATGCPWIVGYIPNNAKFENAITYKTLITDFKTPYVYNAWTNFQYNQYVDASGGSIYTINTYNNIVEILINIVDKVAGNYTALFSYDVDKQSAIELLEIPENFYSYGTATGIYLKNGTTSTVPVKLSGSNIDFVYLRDLIIYKLSTESLVNNYISETSLKADNQLKQYDGTVFKVANVFYDITEKDYEDSIKTINADSSQLSTQLNTLLNSISWDYSKTGSFTEDNYKYNYKYNGVQLLASTRLNSYTATLPTPEARQHITNNGFDIFCMPYSDELNITDVTNQIDIISNKTTNLGIANAIMTALSGQTIDLQILPYCPVIEAFNEQYQNLDVSVLNTTTITNNSTIKGYIIWLNSDSFTGYIDTVTEVPNESKKVINECYMWRLCSPNYSSQFEFNIAKNNGVVYSYNIDCTLRPFNPYIHVNPLFTGDLYGSDFNDKRGLILSGDYSLPLIGSAWEQYQLNNKNYQNSFNREIDSLELQNKYAGIQDVVNAATGAFTGGLSAGLTTLNPLVGIGVGLTSAAAGAFDVNMNKQLRNDALDKTKTLFNYNLQNIQAMPYTINKGTPLDFNNKLFPIIEMYKATDTEIAAFKNKIKWRGMTVNRVGTIQEFIKSGEERYIEAIPLRLSDISDDARIINELSSELQQGFYVGGVY